MLFLRLAADHIHVAKPRGVRFSLEGVTYLFVIIIRPGVFGMSSKMVIAKGYEMMANGETQGLGAGSKGKFNAIIF
jgi:hypothetical protein